MPARSRRPPLGHVADDHPFSEAQFKTLKYQPDYPERFGSPLHARTGAQGFFHWYNDEHLPSALALLTPAVVHAGQAEVALQVRQQVLLQACARHPERFVQGVPKPPQLPEAVRINPPKTTRESDTAVRH